MFVTDFVQIFCFWSSFLAAELTRTRGHKWVVVRSGLLLFFVVQIVSFLQCSIFLKIKNPWLDLSLPNLCASACHSFWREAGPVWHVRQRCWHVLYLFFFSERCSIVQKRLLSSCTIVFTGQVYLQDSALSNKPESSRQIGTRTLPLRETAIHIECAQGTKMGITTSIFPH